MFILLSVLSVNMVTANAVTDDEARAKYVLITALC